MFRIAILVQSLVGVLVVLPSFAFSYWAFFSCENRDEIITKIIIHKAPKGILGGRGDIRPQRCKLLVSTKKMATYLLGMRSMVEVFMRMKESSMKDMRAFQACPKFTQLMSSPNRV